MTEKIIFICWVASIHFVFEYVPLFHCSILYYFALFCTILFYFVLFCSILFYFVLFCSILFYFVLFCSILFYFVLFCWYSGYKEDRDLFKIEKWEFKIKIIRMKDVHIDIEIYRKIEYKWHQIASKYQKETMRKTEGLNREWKGYSMEDWKCIDWCILQCI